MKHSVVLAALLAAFCVPQFGFCQEDQATGDRPELEYEVWSGSINVPDPVAISVDHLGRVFVTQTQRRKIQDLDIRANRDWVPNDVGFQSVEDKRAFYREQLAIGGDDEKQKRHVKDVNQDGHHDWRDLTVISEKLFLLTDNDKDGTADEIKVFAEEFQTEVTGIAAGVLAHDGHVWATIAPDVWRLTDDDDDGVADSRKVMATGFGLHIAYAGHDMHGLTVGPDGKIYWSIGDKGIHVQTADGQTFHYPNQGGVMRCNPDGSDFEVFAHGLRNVQEFAFDQFGNMFGVDNDADQSGERERFVAIVDGMDAGWRCNYQYRGNDYNPWTDEKLWQLPGDEHPAYIVPPISHYMDGPAGFAYNPGTALGPAYRDFFFVTNAPRGIQYAFRTQPDGDSFKMVDAHEIGSGHALVGIAFGPDGGLYGADWDGGYPLDQKGAVVRIDVPEKDRFTNRAETKRLLNNGFADAKKRELETLLSHADRRVRLAAQFELVGQNALDSFGTALTDQKSSSLSRLHSVWGLGQLSRGGNSAAMKSLRSAMQDVDAHVRAQAAKTWGEISDADPAYLLPLLRDGDLHVRVNAGLALARRPTTAAVEVLLSQAESLKPGQHYLRHSITMALAASATSSKLCVQARHSNEMRRLVTVLALRKQDAQHLRYFVNDSSQWVATAAARGIHDDHSNTKALPYLAAAITKNLPRTEAFARRSINANLRIGDIESANRLLAFAANDDQNDVMRALAVKAIGLWLTPPVLDQVEGRRRDLETDSRELDRKRTRETLANLVSSAPVDVRVAAVAAARQLKMDIPQHALISLLHSDAPDDLRVQAMRTVAKQHDEISKNEIVYAAKSSSPELAIVALELMVDEFSKDALPVLEDAITNSTITKVQQAAIAGLAKLESAASKRKIESLAVDLLEGKLSEALHLDVANAAADNASLQAKIADVQKAQAAKHKFGDQPSAIQFAFSQVGGDAKSGERIFQGHLQAQCARCHRIGKRGSNIGPELTKIAKQRDAQYLLRAIVSPSVDIEPKYFTQAILMDTGKIIRGVIKSENDDETVLINDKGKEVRIATDEIEDVSDQKVSLMPDMTEVLKPQEVRDLVAFLSTLQ